MAASTFLTKGILANDIQIERIQMSIPNLISFVNMMFEFSMGTRTTLSPMFESKLSVDELCMHVLVVFVMEFWNHDSVVVDPYHCVDADFMAMPSSICSQEIISKDIVDGQKMGRPAKRYSAVASRYAASTATKKQISPIFEAPSGGHTNMTKLPFITGTCASFGSLNLRFLCPW